MSLEIHDVILQNDVAGPSDVVCSTDTSGLDYPFNSSMYHTVGLHTPKIQINSVQICLCQWANEAHSFRKSFIVYKHKVSAVLAQIVQKNNRWCSLSSKLVVGRTLGFGPQGPGFKSASGSSGSDIGLSL